MIEFLKDLSLWYNLIFTIPILMVVLYLILQIFGLALDFGADVDTDAGEVDVDADVDVDTDTLPALERGLAFINIGKVPLTIVISTFLLFWGITGFACNGIIQRSFGSFPSILILVSCGAAFVVGIIGTKFLAGAIARVFPEVESYSSTNEALLGQVAQVVSGQVTPRFGRAKVKDQYGNVLTVFCKVKDGKEAPKRGDEVVLVDYDHSDNKFEVTRMESE
jgi:hypothetical protein